MTKRNILVLVSVFILSITRVFGQAKKPQIMVFPSDNWMNTNGYVKTWENQGKTSYELDYRRAMIGDVNMKMCISKVSDVLRNRGYPPKMLDESLKNIELDQALTEVTTSKGGEDISSSQIDKILLSARADIMIRLYYDLKKKGPLYYVTFSLEGIDAYTSETIGSVSGSSSPGPESDLSIILEEAVNQHVDLFISKLQVYFNDMLKNGRKISLNVSKFDGWEYDLESDNFGYDELSTLIDDWVMDNTVQGRYNLNFSDDKKMRFESVRIPLYFTDRRGNQKAMDSRRWANDLRKYLQELGITVKVIQRGLGSVDVILGSK